MSAVEPRPLTRIEGGPIWIDLSTHDIEGAKAFYGAVFGWETVDSGADFGHYHMIRSDGRTIGGLMSSLMSETGPTDEPQSPTAWDVYLETADIAATVAAARESGAGVIVEPMPVGPLGTMAVLTDPGQAAVGLWQPDEFSGIEATSAPNVPVWFELMTTDFDAALQFYTDVLSWSVQWMRDSPDPEAMPDYADEPQEDVGMRYVIHSSPNGAVAGMCEANAWLPPGTPSYWRMYIGVTDTDATIEAITARGGALLDGPQDSPFGRVATVADPQGASFQICSAPTAD